MSGVLGGGGSGWNVAADINFADEPSQTLASDGNYTIGGVTWSKINSASDATPMAIVNGTGLVITPNQASDFGTVRTIPAVVLPLASVIPRFWLGMRVRCWMYIAAENCAADLDGVLLLLERGTLATQWLYSGGGIVRWGAAACVASIAGLAPTYATFKTAPKQDVVVVDMFQGVGYRRAAHYAGSWSAGWPTLDTTSSVALAYSSNNWMNQIEANTAALASVLIGAQRSGSLTNLVVTIGAVKVEYRRP